MNKFTQNLIIGIGVLSIIAGIYTYFSETEKFNAFFGIFIGVVLIGSIYISKKGLDRNHPND